jgi:hypothetical protein
MDVTFDEVMAGMDLGAVVREVDVSCPDGDGEAKVSAFLSEVAVSEYACYFAAWLAPEEP